MKNVQINGPRIGASADVPADPKEMATLEGSILRVQELGEALSDPELIQTLKTVDDHGIIVNALEGFAVEMAVSLEPTQVWIKQFGSSDADISWGISIDSNNNIYVTGWTLGSLSDNNNLGLNDAFLTKYDASGKQLWVKQFGTSNSEYALGISLDSNNNIYVTGWTLGSLPDNNNLGRYDAYIAKYDANSNQVWVRQFGTSDFDSAVRSQIDSSGNVYVTGYTNGFVLNGEIKGEDAFIAKYDAEGNQLWIQQFGSSETDNAQEISIDSNGNIYVTGYTDGSLLGNSNFGGRDAYITKYDAAGNQLWIRQFGTSDSDESIGIKFDSSDNLYATGRILRNL